MQFHVVVALGRREERLQHEAEAAYLHEAGAHAEVEAGTNQQRHKGRAPHHAVDL